jgi:hypothetical protein
MFRPAALLKQSLLFAHRWLGVAFCLPFLLWFTTGVVMMYHDFPTVTGQDRLDRAPPLDASRILLSPSEAAARAQIAQPAPPIRLRIFNGRPLYSFPAAAGERLIYADTGEEQTRVSPAMMERAASAFVGQPASAATRESLDEVDQWTVYERLYQFLPFSKYSWPDGRQVYISALSGEVVQSTTTASRFWAWLGPIPHWLYFTPLRKHEPAWIRVVVWTSGIATAAAILGIAIGIWMYSPARRYRYAGKRTAIPYRGPKRWHLALGLIFGAAACTWAFSGMLSMGPFPAVASPGALDFPQALRGPFPFAAFAAKSPRQALQQLDGLPVRQLALASFGGDPVYLATLAHAETRIVPVLGRPIAAFDPDRIREIAASALGPANLAEIRLLSDYDLYYLDRHHARPLPVVLVRLNDPANTRYYIDPKTGTVVAQYSSRAWVTRWLYHGLHSFDFPWLYRYRPLWDIVVLSLLAGGTALCGTSVVLAWRVLRRQLLPAPAVTSPPPNEAACSNRSTESARRCTPG